MGDDVNAPNPDTFILPDTLAEFVNIVYDKLPFGRWDCYLGKYIKTDSPNPRLEDGIMVLGINPKYEAPIIARCYNEDGKVIIKHEEIVNYPYLYFYKKD